jgi:hypothetical protein
VERGVGEVLCRLEALGLNARTWGEAVVNARGVRAVRVLIGLKALATNYQAQEIDEACRKALACGAYRLRTIRRLLTRQVPEQTQFEFIEEHPIIRPLSDYSLESLHQFRKERPDERSPD